MSTDIHFQYVRSTVTVVEKFNNISIHKKQSRFISVASIIN